MAISLTQLTPKRLTLLSPTATVGECRVAYSWESGGNMVVAHNVWNALPMPLTTLLITILVLALETEWQGEAKTKR